MFAPGFAQGAIFFLLWLVIMIGMVIGWVIFLIAVWRGMRAHESMASSLRSMAQHRERKIQGDADRPTQATT